MKDIREVFIDKEDETHQLVIKRYSDGSVFIGVHEGSSYRSYQVNPSQFKAVRKAIKKVTKEDTIS